MTPIPGSLELAEAPAQELDRLWETDPDCAAHVEAALDALNRVPSAASNRRRQIRREAGGPLWGIDVICRDSTLLILWETDPDGIVVVLYLGPPF